jgi:hypothetical protein
MNPPKILQISCIQLHWAGSLETNGPKGNVHG